MKEFCFSNCVKCFETHEKKVCTLNECQFAENSTDTCVTNTKYHMRQIPNAHTIISSIFIHWLKWLSFLTIVFNSIVYILVLFLWFHSHQIKSFKIFERDNIYTNRKRNAFYTFDIVYCKHTRLYLYGSEIM